jgi:hypothetical protein
MPGDFLTHRGPRVGKACAGGRHRAVSGHRDERRRSVVRRWCDTYGLRLGA